MSRLGEDGLDPFVADGGAVGTLAGVQEILGVF